MYLILCTVGILFIRLNVCKHIFNTNAVGKYEIGNISAGFFSRKILDLCLTHFLYFEIRELLIMINKVQNEEISYYNYLIK